METLDWHDFLRVAAHWRNAADPDGRSRRFPSWIGHTLLLQSRGRCAITGCDAPFLWLQADHIQPAGRGGPTNLANGQPLGGPHNHHKADHPKDDHPKDDQPTRLV